MTKKCGKIAILGRPNVGKSTLVNTICKTHLSITSPKPQTTRVSVKAIVTHSDSQLIFIDNPGFNTKKSLLDRQMKKFVMEALTAADVVVFMTQMEKFQLRSISNQTLTLHKLDEALYKEIKNSGKNIDIVLINKIDTLKKREYLLPLIDLLHRSVNTSTIIPISALKNKMVQEFIDEVKKLLPEREFLFNPDYISDMSERFFAAEMIREKIFTLLSQEVPYSTAVVVEHWEEENDKIVIGAKVYVEKEGQKAIIIGKSANMIKKIGILARKKIEKFFHSHVYLQLHVDVRKNWKEKAGEVESMIKGGN